MLAAIARAITAHAAHSAREVATQLAQERATNRAAAVRGTLATARRYVPVLLIVAAILGFIYWIGSRPKDCPDCVEGSIIVPWWPDSKCDRCGGDGTLND